MAALRNTGVWYGMHGLSMLAYAVYPRTNAAPMAEYDN